ncbi:hypothetical protein PoB_001180200 [Plakobranchus ocellatus]|uniref:Uncharacterized protein n=1 Tax=Plakobranchus ocellatus TaxID=259542 RepID=A0AAV3YT31_9GAST|nr:hypothetical protein PoB_001180200 [Plakobranchus ocellatus]
MLKTQIIPRPIRKGQRELQEVGQLSSLPERLKEGFQGKQKASNQKNSGKMFFVIRNQMQQRMLKRPWLRMFTKLCVHGARILLEIGRQIQDLRNPLVSMECCFIESHLDSRAQTLKAVSWLPSEPKKKGMPLWCKDFAEYRNANSRLTKSGLFGEPTLHPAVTLSDYKMCDSRHPLLELRSLISAVLGISTVNQVIRPRDVNGALYHSLEDPDEMGRKERAFDFKQ